MYWTLPPRARRAETVLDSVTSAAFILNGNGRIVHLNAAADALAQGKLQALVGSAAAASSASLSQPGGVIALSRPSGQRALQVLVLPLPIRGDWLSAQVLVLLGEPDRTASFLETVLSALYGLTRAEMEISNALLSGRSAEEIAQQRSDDRYPAYSAGIHISEGRNPSQRDLIKLLLSPPAHPLEQN
ncbi:MAG: hypothetical protein ACREU2_10155 [Steroidobacteraceae bacterium]